MLTILAGGTGSVKLVRGFKKDDISIVCNVGDNIWLYDLYICPDIDTIIYGLADLLDKERGWGIKDDTFNFLEQLKIFGIEPWFNLGDKDLAMHVLRTKMIREGKRLYEITKFFKDKLDIKADIIPATEDDLQTLIQTDLGLMHLQEFWVKYKGKLEVKDVIYKNIDNAKATDKAIEAIIDADAIIIAPGNPISSINPILSIYEINNTLIKYRDKCMAISPVIGEEVISGPAAKYMRALGYKISSYSIAKFYSRYISKFIIDVRDEKYITKIEGDFKIKVYTTNIIMRNEEDEYRLAKFVKSVI